MRRCSTALQAAILAVPLLWACAGDREAVSAEKSGKEKGSTVKIALTLPKTRFVQSEDVPLHVAVANEGSAPAEVPDPFNSMNWQPVYTLTGPKTPQGLAFSGRSAVMRDTRPEPPGERLKMTSVPPGKSIEDDLPLRTWAPISAPGDYKISATLKWNGSSVESAGVPFTIEPLAARGASVGVDFGCASASEGVWVLLVHESPAGKRLYEGMLAETRPDLGEASLRYLNPICDLGAEAEGPMASWTNHDRRAALPFWRSWREGSRLLARPIRAKEPQSVDLGAAPKMVLRPAMMSAAGDLDLFTVSAGEPTLSLARFCTPPKSGAAKPPQVMWRHPLEAEPLAARCVLDPAGGKERRHVAFVVAHEDALRIYHLTVPADGGAPSSDFIHIPNATLVAGCEPALRVDADGNLHAALLAWTNHEERQLAVVEVAFDGIAAKPKITDMGRIDADAKAAAIQFQFTPADSPRLEWALVLTDGRVLSGGATGRRHVFAPSYPPVLPLELIPLSQATYLLFIDPERGPRMVSI